MIKHKLTETFEFVAFPKPKKQPKTVNMWKAYYKKKKKVNTWNIGKFKRIVVKKASKKVKRSKLPSIKSIKNKAWNLFATFIKNRDKKCVLCGSIKGLSAGHLISRQRTAVKFDENNVFGLCSTCNFKDRFVEGYHDIFVAWYIDNYGALPYTDLVERSKGIKQFKRCDFEEIIEKYGSKTTL